jgi:hypothetical protein
VLRTQVTRHVDARLTIGHVLPPGAEVAAVTLDGRAVEYSLQTTARGREVLVSVGAGATLNRLAVRLR